jgi:hypothetical protein
MLFIVLSPFRRLILHVLYSKHDHVLVAKLFIDSMKCKLSPKVMKSVKMSSYLMWRFP